MGGNSPVASSDLAGQLAALGERVNGWLAERDGAWEGAVEASDGAAVPAGDVRLQVAQSVRRICALLEKR